MKNTRFLILALIVIELTVIASCSRTQVNDKKVIDNFLQAVEDGDVSYQKLIDQGLVYQSQSYRELEQKNDAKKLYNLMIIEISKQLESCHNQTVLSLQESKKTMQYDEILDYPEGHSVYIIYCDSSILTRVLMRDGQVASFGTMNKGGSRVFFVDPGE